MGVITLLKVGVATNRLCPVAGLEGRIGRVEVGVTTKWPEVGVSVGVVTNRVILCPVAELEGRIGRVEVGVTAKWPEVGVSVGVVTTRVLLCPMAGLESKIGSAVETADGMVWAADEGSSAGGWPVRGGVGMMLSVVGELGVFSFTRSGEWEVEESRVRAKYYSFACKHCLAGNICK